MSGTGDLMNWQLRQMRDAGLFICRCVNPDPRPVHPFPDAWECAGCHRPVVGSADKLPYAMIHPRTLAAMHQDYDEATRPCVG